MFPPERAAVLRRPVSGRRLDLVQPRNKPQRLMRPRGIRSFGLPPVPPRMGPAGDLDDLPRRINVQAVITPGGIRLQVAFKPLQPLGRSIPSAALREVVHRIRMLPIPDVGPEPRLSGMAQLGGRLDVFLAPAAGILDPDVLNDLERGRNVLQLLARLLADLTADIAAAWTAAFFFREFVATLFVGEMSRQFPAAVALFLALARPSLFDLRLLSQFRGQGGEIIAIEQQELIGIDPFLLRSIQTPEQPGNLVLLLVDLLLLRLDRLFQVRGDGGRLSELLLEALTGKNIGAERDASRFRQAKNEAVEILSRSQNLLTVSPLLGCF
jgi:hypothetical protein